MVTFAVFLLLWVITWIGSFSGPTVDKLTQYLSIIDHFDDFGKGRHRHDAPHLLPELHHVRAVPDREVGRQRTVARLMVNRILSLIGWLGTALVFVAVAIRFGYPAKEQYAYYLAWAGLVCVLAYTLGQWREIAQVFARRQARYGTLAASSVARRPRHPGRDQLHRHAAEQALGPDRRASSSACRTRAATCSPKLDAPLQVHGVRAGAASSRATRTG